MPKICTDAGSEIISCVPSLLKFGGYLSQTSHANCHPSFIHPGSTFVVYLREASSKIAKHVSFPSFPYVVACFEIHGESFYGETLYSCWSKKVGVSVPQLENPCDFLPFPNIILTANPWHVPHLRIPEPPEANRRPIAFGKPRIFRDFLLVNDEKSPGWSPKVWVKIILDFLQEE